MNEKTHRIDQLILKNLCLLGLLLSSLFGWSQERFTKYGLNSFSQSLLEYDDHYYLSFVDEIVGDTMFAHQFYKLDESLNRVDSLEYDVSELLGGNGILTGRFVADLNGLRFVGLGAYKHEVGTFNMPEDSTFFVRLSFDDDLNIVATNKLFLRAGFYSITDILIENDRYVLSASDGLLGYWVGSVDMTLSSHMHSENRFLDPGGIPTYNPYALTKIVRNFENEGVHLRIDVAHMDVYANDMSFDSTYQIPMVDFGVPAYGWMSQGYAELSNSYFVSSSSGGSSYVLQLNPVHEYVNEFFISHSDSLVTNSLYRCLAKDNEENLLLGMHIRDSSDPNFSLLKVVKCDTTGSIIWQSTFGEGGALEYRHREIKSTEDNGVLMMADRYSSPDLEFADGIIIYKLNSNGQIVGMTEFLAEESHFRLFPNPCTEILNIDSRTKFDFIQIINSNGQIVLHGSSNNSYDVSGLRKGVYFVNFINEDLILYTERLVVE